GRDDVGEALDSPLASHEDEARFPGVLDGAEERRVRRLHGVGDGGAARPAELVSGRNRAGTLLTDEITCLFHGLLYPPGRRSERGTARAASGRAHLVERVAATTHDANIVAHPAVTLESSLI